MRLSHSIFSIVELGIFALSISFAASCSSAFATDTELASQDSFSDHTEGPPIEGRYRVKLIELLNVGGRDYYRLSIALNSPGRPQPTLLRTSEDSSGRVQRAILGAQAVVTGAAAYATVTGAGSRQISAQHSDKVRHFSAGYVIGNVTTGFLQLVIPKDTKHRKLIAALGGVGLAAVAGAGKEIRDKVTRKGTPDIVDAEVTLVGGAVGSLAISAGDVKQAFRRTRRTPAPPELPRF